MKKLDWMQIAGGAVAGALALWAWNKYKQPSGATLTISTQPSGQLMPSWTPGLSTQQAQVAPWGGLL